MDRADAIGWIVAVVDLDGGPTAEHGYGLFETPEQALVAAGEMAASTPAEGAQAGWDHVVIPIFPP